MAPERSPKRVKTNQVPREGVETVPAALIPLPEEQEPTRAQDEQPKTPTKQDDRSSWYNRTWPRKAAPVTQVAKESISSASNVTSEAVAAVTDRASTKAKLVRSGSLQILGKTRSNRSTPVVAETTKIHATPETSTPSRKQPTKLEAWEKEQMSDTGKVTASTTNDKSVSTKNRIDISSPAADPDLASDGPGISAKIGHVKEISSVSNTSSTWLPWFSKTGPEGDGQQQPSTPAHEPSAAEADHQQKPSLQVDESLNEQPKPVSSQETPQAGNKRGWLQIWSNETTERTSSAPPVGRSPMTPEKPNENATTKSLLGTESGQNVSGSHSKASSIDVSPPPALPHDGTKPSGWVFWSRDRSANEIETSSSKEGPHAGEIAISDTPSQDRPRKASISMPDSSRKPIPKAQIKPESPAPSTNNKGKTAVATKDKKTTDSLPVAGTTKAQSSNAAAKSKAPVEAPPTEQRPSIAIKKSPPNLLLPAFKDTFIPQQNPSIFQQIGRLLYYNKAPEPKHLSLVRESPRIRSALAIGVHGYFPAPLIRTVLGQPTGTSIKFADMAAKAIQRWTHSHGYDCQVKTAALEGEGKIADRIELLWKLLLNWIDEIRRADFVMIACHSQGVPVAIMLVAKLIQFGCVNSARVGICAMAGVSMGPFQEFKSRWISGSAGELFEFSDPASRVSTDYLAALDTVLKFGVRVSFIGSIDDQLVSLESSLFTPISHPHIYRAVLIDSRVHAPNFLSHLVGFALKLRNLGVADHGLIRELSPPLAGSLYTGEGHSRIYEDESVYDLAVAFALETNGLTNITPTQRASVASVSNPYILPFAMRGILEEDFVKTDLQSEVLELLKQFDEWKPTTKVLKDVKFRLEGVRSKL